jgi:hypothetical protein
MLFALEGFAFLGHTLIREQVAAPAHDRKWHAADDPYLEPGLENLRQRRRA